MEIGSPHYDQLATLIMSERNQVITKTKFEYVDIMRLFISINNFSIR